MKLSEAESAAYLEVVRAANKRTNMDPAMDRLILAVRAAMPCFRCADHWRGFSENKEGHLLCFEPDTCPTCEARAALKETLGA